MTVVEQNNTILKDIQKEDKELFKREDGGVVLDDPVLEKA